MSVERVLLTRRYRLECAHRLNGLRDGHKCSRLHGHNYEVQLTVAMPADKLVNGMVIDAENLDTDVRPVFAKLDHHFLNELGGEEPLPGMEPGQQIHLHGLRSAFAPLNEQPTAENFALYLWRRLQFLSNNGSKRLVRVRVYENEDLWAEVGE